MKILVPEGAQDWPIGELKLDDGAILEGRVVCPHGHPLPGRVVRVDGQECRSDLDGYYRFNELSDDTEYPITVDGEPAGSSKPDVGVLRTVLDRWVIRFRVVDGSWRPLPESIAECWAGNIGRDGTLRELDHADHHVEAADGSGHLIVDTEGAEAVVLAATADGLRSEDVPVDLDEVACGSSFTLVVPIADEPATLLIDARDGSGARVEDQWYLELRSPIADDPIASIDAWSAERFEDDPEWARQLVPAGRYRLVVGWIETAEDDRARVPVRRIRELELSPGAVVRVPLAFR